MSQTTRMAMIIVAAVLVASWSSAVEVPFGDELLVDSAFDGAAGLAVADFDRDGDLDVAGVARNGNEVALWEHTSSSWVKKTLNTSPYDTANVVVTGDVDGDGWIDVVAGKAGSQGGAGVYWWRNPEGSFSATWTPSVVCGALGGIRSIELTDLDQDGDLDAVVARFPWSTPEDGFIDWCDNTTGDGAHFHCWQVRNNIDGPHSVSVADFGGDGDLDILVASYSTDRIFWLVNDGSIHDDDPWPAAVSWSGLDDVLYVNTVDINSDGAMDFLAAVYGEDEVLLFVHTGPGTADYDIDALPGGLDGPYSAETADIDLDGDLDVVATGRGVDQVVWWENRGSTISSWHKHVIGSGFDLARFALPADLDNDGDMDVIAAAEGDDDISYWLNRRIHPRALFNDSGVVDDNSDYIVAVEAADMDNDGDLDLVGISDNTLPAVTDAYIWYNLNGAGTSWDTREIPFQLDGASDLVVGDIDGDGLQEMVIAVRDDDAIVWIKATPGGGTLKAPVASGVGGPTGVDLGDIDGDGDLDIVAALADDGEVRWWRNEIGSGLLWTEFLLFSADDCEDVEVVDINVDGLPDIISSNDSTDELYWLRNSGNPNVFFFGGVIDSSFETAHIESADLNGDGRPDVLATDKLNDEVAVWLNSGTGASWTKHVVSTTMDRPMTVGASDLDSDGDQDIFVVSESDDRLRWYNNSGGGTFWASHQVSSSVNGARGVCAGDLDRDGMMDLATAAWVGGRVDRWINDGGQASLTAVSTGVTSVDAGDRTALLRLAATLPQWWMGDDATGELNAMAFIWTDGASHPYPPAVVNSSFDRVSIYHDTNGSGTFEEGSDTLVAMQSPIVVDPAAYVCFLPAPAGSPNPELNDSIRRFFAVLDIAAGAQEIPFELIMGPSARYRDLGSVLTVEDPKAYSSGLITIDASQGLIFEDGFESGNTSHWDAVVGN